MVRLLSLSIECFSSLIFIIPIVFLLKYTLFKEHSFYKVMTTFIFSIYIMAVFSVVGIPTIHTIRVYPSFNLIPLIDIANSPIEYIKNTILNIILFMPMGFLLPAVWKEYRQIKKTIFIGLAVSIFIEVLQIFTFRLTDIDDLITNTLGTILGYFVWKMFSSRLPLQVSENINDISVKNLSTKISVKNIFVKYEPIIILLTAFLIGFFMKPLISNTIWDIVLSSSLWESIK